jgi:hypothetical protein
MTNDGSASFRIWVILVCGKLGSIGTYAAPAFQVASKDMIVLKEYKE